MTNPIAESLRAKAADGEVLLAAGAGIGLSAVCAHLGGADLIVAYNSGRYRMAGRGSTAGYLAYGDCNAIVLELAGELIPVSGETPVVAGVLASDPFRQMPRYLRELQDHGYRGVQNFPTVGLIDGRFRQSLEETGMGYDHEIELVRQASNLGLLTTPYVFDEDQARRMADAGADVVVAHMGVTVKGLIGAETSMTLDAAAERCRRIAEAAQSVNPDVLVFCHGGPIAEVDDVSYVVGQVPSITGFFGASSTERHPTEVAITQRIREFKRIRATGGVVG